MCICTGMCVCQSTCKGEKAHLKSLSPPSTLCVQGIELGHQAWLQDPLLAKPAHWPRNYCSFHTRNTLQKCKDQLLFYFKDYSVVSTLADVLWMVKCTRKFPKETKQSLGTEVNAFFFFILGEIYLALK